MEDLLVSLKHALVGISLQSVDSLNIPFGTARLHDFA